MINKFKDVWCTSTLPFTINVLNRETFSGIFNIQLKNVMQL